MEKIILFFTLIILQGVAAHAQDQEFEKKNYFELKGRAKFYEIDDRYHLYKDTVFYTNSGFLINPEWDETVIDGKAYLIITYPKFSNGVQYSGEPEVESTQSTSPVYFPLRDINGKTLAIPKEEFDKIDKAPIYSINFLKSRNYQITTGQLTLPFKLRPAIKDKKFQMTTDVTIGAYGGIRKRLSKRSPMYITIPLVLGLSFINVNESTTDISGSADLASGITPGWTWSTGLVFQFNKFNAGFVLGRDYASGFAEDWIYHAKTWYSFAIGYSFVN